MKKIFLVLQALIIPFIIHSQNENTGMNISSFPDKGYVSNEFVENTFISIAAGVQVYDGEDDHLAKDKDRLSPALNISLGKWFSPGYGIRVSYNGIEMRQYTPMHIQIDNENIQEMLLRDKIKTGYIHMDMMFNLSDALGTYRENRIYSFIPYVGAGIIHMWNGPGYTDYAMSCGLINRFRLGSSLDFLIDAMIGAVPGSFDGIARHHFDCFISANAGFIYKFGGNKRWQAVSEYNPYHNDEFKRDNDRINRYVNDLRLKIEKERANSMYSMKKIKDIQDLLYSEYAKSDENYNEIPCTLFFEPESVEADLKGMVSLTNYAKTINSAPDNTNFVISYFEYIDNNDDYKKTNCQLRAKTIKDILVKEFNVDEEKLIIKKGEFSSMTPDFNNVIFIEKK